MYDIFLVSIKIVVQIRKSILFYVNVLQIINNLRKQKILLFIRKISIVINIFFMKREILTSNVSYVAVD